MGLGDAQLVSLAEARDEARKFLKLLRRGVDPLEHRRGEKAEAKAARGVSTFRDVAEAYMAAHEATWRNAHHRYRWRQTLELAHAVFGDQSVTAITTGDVVRVLEPIWRTKTETASRLRGRIETVLDYASARGWRTSENPAR